MRFIGTRDLAHGDVEPPVWTAAKRVDIGPARQRLGEQRFVTLLRCLPHALVHLPHDLWGRFRPLRHNGRTCCALLGPVPAPLLTA
ncbi:MAG: hypothetical protein ACK55Z_22345, partial [bacterium]